MTNGGIAQVAVALKICGVTRPDDLALCQSLGVDAVGINLWPASSRGMSMPAAQRLVEAVPRSTTLRVGVFVDATPEQVALAHAQLQLDAVQLHGDGAITPFAALGIPYVWVVRGTPELATLRIPTPAPTWVVLDAHVAGYGGQGERTDWTWAAQAVRALAPVPVWLAGGITPDNAQRAIATVRPAGLDVATGSEHTPGNKDPAKIEALLRACGR
jgi:phosphoribosylanthranilate isomerase